jgi:hypothetical protein
MTVSHLLCFGLPRDFDFAQVRTTDDACSLMCTLPNGDRGDAARGLYRARKRTGTAVAYAGMMAAYDHDPGPTLDAFGSVFKFANALRLVAPKHERTEPIRVWRAIAVEKANPKWAAAGVSWTTDRNVAAWFALRFYREGCRPFVFCADIKPTAAIAFHDERQESEVIVDLSGLGPSITVDHDGTPWSSLTENSAASVAAVASWHDARDAYNNARAAA